MSLIYRERPAAGDPAGLLILHHGRGADEHDLLGLADVLDPQRRLHVVTPRAPLTCPAGRATTGTSCRASAIPTPTRSTPPTESSPRSMTRSGSAPASRPEQTVLGGFSMGSVMSYALGLAGDRPVPAGILAFSGFIPTVDGWQPDLGSREHCRCSSPMAATTRSWTSRSPAARGSCLRAAGLPVTYLESDAAHHIDPAHVPAATSWLTTAIGENAASTKGAA